VEADETPARQVVAVARTIREMGRGNALAELF
jgi:hypothetical protein